MSQSAQGTAEVVSRRTDMAPLESFRRDSGTPTSGLVRWIPFIGVLVPGLSLLFWYVRGAFVDVILLDGFIHIPFIGKGLEPHGTLAHVVRAPFAAEHFLLPYRLLLFVNAKLFALDMRLDPIMFVLAFAVVAAVLYSEHTRILPYLRPIPSYLSFLPLGLLSFTLVAPPMILMATQFAWSSSVGLVVAWLVGRDLHWGDGQALWRRPLGGALAAIPLYFLLSGAYFFGIILGLAAMYVFRQALERPPWLDRRFVSVGAMLLVCGITYTYLMVEAISGPGTRGLGGFTIPFSNFKNTVLSFVAGMSAALVDTHTWETTSSAVLLGVGLLGSMIAAFALWIFVKTKMYLRTYLPVYCIFYAIGIITMVVGGRSGQGWRWITSEWYAFHLRFLVIGIVWILVYAMLDALHRVRESSLYFTQRRAWAVAMIVVSAGFIVGCQTVGNVAQWKRMPHLKEYYEQKRLALLYPALFEKPEEILLWPEVPLRSSRQVLKKYSLSSFSPDSRAEVDRRLQRGPLRSTTWYGDDWVGGQATMIFASRVSQPLKLNVRVPDFLQSNQCEFRLNGTLLFAGEIRSESAETLLGELLPRTNVLSVDCNKAVSPISVAKGQDARPLSVQVELQRGAGTAPSRR